MAEFSLLEKNLKDNVIEAQLKLGYDPAPMRFYYPQDTVEHLAQTGSLSEKELLHELFKYCHNVKDRVGEIGIEVKAERYCFCLSPASITYFWENAGNQDFLKDLVAVMQGHIDSIEEIKKVFDKYSDSVICKEMKDEDFNYLLHFADGNPDDYMYCFQLDECGAIYHRFTRFDYEKLFGKNAL